MKKNILNEINRVREIMGFETLNEQNYSIGKTVVKGDPSKQEPIEIVIDKIAKYKVLDDAAESVAGPFIEEVIEKLSEKFGGDLQKAIDAGMTLRKAIIRSGASNVYGGGSTEANVENDRFTPAPQNQDVKFKKGDRPYEKNLALAKSRGTNFLSYIKAALKNKGINNLDSLESEDIQAVIVDTGGVIDKDRVESTHPHPGQFITMDLVFDKPGKEGELLAECLVTMKIYVGYYREGNEYSGGKKSSQNHTCDSAIFDVFLNGIKVMTVNLNNLRDRDLLNSKDYRIVNPERRGDTVVCGVGIDNALAQKIMSETNSETIEVGIKGMIEGGSPPGGRSGSYMDRHKPGAPAEHATYKGEPIYYEGNRWDQEQLNLHSQVPMVTLRWDDGQEWVGEPDVKLRRGDNSYRKIMTFDVCRQEVDAGATT